MVKKMGGVVVEQSKQSSHGAKGWRFKSQLFIFSKPSDAVQCELFWIRPCCEKRMWERGNGNKRWKNQQVEWIRERRSVRFAEQRIDMERKIITCCYWSLVVHKPIHMKNDIWTTINKISTSGGSNIKKRSKMVLIKFFQWKTHKNLWKGHFPHNWIQCSIIFNLLKSYCLLLLKNFIKIWRGRWYKVGVHAVHSSHFSWCTVHVLRS